jgi:hypothetical protein
MRYDISVEYALVVMMSTWCFHSSLLSKKRPSSHRMCSCELSVYSAELSDLGRWKGEDPGEVHAFDLRIIVPLDHQILSKRAHEFVQQNGIVITVKQMIQTHYLLSYINH